ncbi:hypothetical protein N0V82_003008 [Gnomoniopsis sp. IMI 355080]|nr:hypothetical protein N0V82_003008 [Gnomoniopsis sp. IMI 355080]
MKRGLGGAVVDYVRAKAFGGCSTINDVAYSRGSKGAFQLWADTVGDQSFVWDEVLPYYEKSMNFTPPNNAARFANSTPTYDSSLTAQGGPLDITYPAYGESWSTWIAQGLASIGLPRVGALIEGTLYGSTYQLLTVNPDTGRRASSDTAFLRPILDRSNLFIFKETLAERILIKSNKVATGVEVTTSDNSTASSFMIKAAKEVILSAGVVQSPQLLMVSGIGPADVLEQNKINVVADLPGVGQGLLDHILIPMTWQVNLETPDITSVLTASAFDDNQPATGPLTNPGGDYAGLEKIPTAFRANWSTETTKALSKLPSDWPEVEYLVRPFAVSGGTVAGDTYASLFIVLQAPQSLGNVSIASASMRDAPLINPNWLTAQADLDVLLAAVKRIRQMAATPAMSEVIIGSEFLPGSKYESDAALLEYFKIAGTSIHHGHATNKMGNASDRMSVVGSTGKVHGIRNYMLAEKLADAIEKGK